MGGYLQCLLSGVPTEALWLLQIGSYLITATHVSGVTVVKGRKIIMLCRFQERKEVI